MRPTEDLAFRARNWFWYWRVRAISGLSNDRLDLKCFGNQGRRRHFERLQATASAPDEVALVDGQTLLAIVDGWDRPDDGGPGPYACATRDFHSPLWGFLATRDQEPSTYSDFVQRFAEERGWMRAHTRDYPLYLTFLGRDEPAIELGVFTAYSAMLHKLVNDITPDATAALVALFREAMHHVELERAIAIRTALTTSIMNLGECLGIARNVTELIQQLARDRVLANRWVTEADWRKHTDTSLTRGITSRARVREFQAWVSWYTRRPKTFNYTGYGQFPIVPRSARTDWLEAHRYFLAQVEQEVSYLFQNHINLKDSEVPEIQRIAEDLRIRADGLLSHFNPPDPEPARFYTTRPNIEMGNLPEAYPDKRESTARSAALADIELPDSPASSRPAGGNSQ